MDDELGLFPSDCSLAGFLAVRRVPTIREVGVHVLHQIPSFLRLLESLERLICPLSIPVLFVHTFRSQVRARVSPRTSYRRGPWTDISWQVDSSAATALQLTNGAELETLTASAFPLLLVLFLFFVFVHLILTGEAFSLKATLPGTQ